MHDAIGTLLVAVLIVTLSLGGAAVAVWLLGLRDQQRRESPDEPPEP